MGGKTQLQVDIYVAPVIPAATGFPDYERSAWSPISCVLVHGPKEAALIDAPITIEQGKEISEWIRKVAPGKKLKYFYTTHTHPDHYAAVSTIKEEFPELEFVATGNVVSGIEAYYSVPVYEQIWTKGFFAGKMHEAKPVPTALPADGKFYIDGEALQGIEVGHTDTEFSSFLHVPAVDLVVTGDIVYGDCHQHFGEANTNAKRKEWLDAIDTIEAKKPHIVIAGHKRPSQADAPYLFNATRNYIYRFQEELAKAKSPEELFDTMKAIYPQRWNQFILHTGCFESFKHRDEN